LISAALTSQLAGQLNALNIDPIGSLIIAGDAIDDLVAAHYQYACNCLEVGISDLREFHEILKDQMAEYLKGDHMLVETEISLHMVADPAVNARLDIMAKTTGGYLFGLEIKTGFDPPYTLGQQAVYPHLPIDGLVFSTSPKVGTFGIAVGQPLPPMGMFEAYEQGPGTGVKIIDLERFFKDGGKL
jgi:hypothetical protein